jgi:hypothetical protein
MVGAEEAQWGPLDELFEGHRCFNEVFKVDVTDWVEKSSAESSPRLPSLDARASARGPREPPRGDALGRDTWTTKTKLGTH